MVQYQKSNGFSPPSLISSFSYFTEKGYGFIQPDDGYTEVFVHRSAIQMKGVTIRGFQSLAEGGKVEFRTEVDAEGKIRAVNVTGENGSGVLTAAFRSPSGKGEHGTSKTKDSRK
jgi:CspA family cold shock protein